jgi:hypothetical protein
MPTLTRIGRWGRGGIGGLLRDCALRIAHTNDNSNFGKIFYTCNAPREVQMALKLYW